MAYIPGSSYGDDEVIKERSVEEHIHGGTCRGTELDFSVNINPLGMPEGCMEAAGKALLGVPSYPDTCHDELIRELSLRNGGHHVILGNGSCELIYALCHYLGHRYPGYLAYTLVPTFTEYRYAVSASGGRNRFFYTGAGDDFALAGRIDEFIDMIKSSVSEGEPVKLVFLCNPNNPTGELTRSRRCAWRSRPCRPWRRRGAGPRKSSCRRTSAGSSRRR